MNTPTQSDNQPIREGSRVTWERRAGEATARRHGTVERIVVDETPTPGLHAYVIDGDSGATCYMPVAHLDPAAAPVHLYDRATWECHGDDGTVIGHSTDMFTGETASRHAGYGDTLVDLWSVYRTADGERLFSVNPDGSLRGIRDYAEAVSA